MTSDYSKLDIPVPVTVDRVKAPEILYALNVDNGRVIFCKTFFFSFQRLRQERMKLREENEELQLAQVAGTRCCASYCVKFEKLGDIQKKPNLPRAGVELPTTTSFLIIKVSEEFTFRV